MKKMRKLKDIVERIYKSKHYERIVKKSLRTIAKPLLSIKQYTGLPRSSLRKTINAARKAGMYSIESAKRIGKMVNPTAHIKKYSRLSEGKIKRIANIVRMKKEEPPKAIEETVAKEISSVKQEAETREYSTTPKNESYETDTYDTKQEDTSIKKGEDNYGQLDPASKVYKPIEEEENKFMYIIRMNLEKLGALPKGPFKKIDQATIRLKEIFFSKYK